MKIKIGKLLFYKNKFLPFSKLISHYTFYKLTRKSNVKRIVLENINYVGQATHPDVLFDCVTFPNKVVLTVSGYPYELAKYENPYVFISDDGISFKNVLNNRPVVEYQGIGKSHYSDSEIFEINSELYCLYRMCYEDCLNPYVEVYLSKYNDAFKSSYLLSKANGKDLVSPSVVSLNKGVKLFYVDATSNKHVLCYSNIDFSNFSLENRYVSTLNNVPENGELWHIDVYIYNNTLIGLFTFSFEKNAERTDLYIAISNDNGETWMIKNRINLGLNYKYIKRVYRSSMYIKNKIVYLYSSICAYNDAWYVIEKEFLLEEIL